jgi:myo-inositol-1(or 4)-monophosphatase
MTNESINNRPTFPQDGLQLAEACRIAQDIAINAGAILVQMRSTFELREKSEKDLVTDADVAAQVAIASAIARHFPEHGFLGEEGSAGVSQKQRDNNSNSRWKWVVDPLDGTTNYAHGLSQFGVSLALTYDLQPVLGVVYDPVAQECYSAVDGQGAQLNGIPLKTSGCTHLSKALVAASFPPKLNRDAKEIQQFVEMLLESRSLRRLGSAALNLCYVAAGRLDGYWGGRLNAWDIAAGVLILQESKGEISGQSGGKIDIWRGDLIAAATASLHQQMLSVLSRISTN